MKALEEELKKHPVLCYVWNNDDEDNKNIEDKYTAIIISYYKEFMYPFISINDEVYMNAIPVPKEDLIKYSFEDINESDLLLSK